MAYYYSLDRTKPVDKKTRYYRDWRTYQMSGHLPKWIEVKIDFGEEYLRNKSM